jgi:hypothetical protein
MADALANVIAVFPSTDSARWIVARLSYRFFLGALAVWLAQGQPLIPSIPKCRARNVRFVRFGPHQCVDIRRIETIPTLATFARSGQARTMRNDFKK